MTEPLSEEQLRIAETGASHETDVLCAEIRRLLAEVKELKKDNAFALSKIKGLEKGGRNG